jgi:hypothetical protein
MDILTSIATWIQRNNVEIAGIVYLHQITDIRFTGASRMHLKILKAMCGQNFFPHIVLSSTMWDRLSDDCAYTEAETREKELVSSPDIWETMIRNGSKYMRYTGSQESGNSMIYHLLAKQGPPSMAIVQQLRNPIVMDTTAGQVITEESRKREEKLRQDLLEEEEEDRLLKADLKSERAAAKRDTRGRSEQRVVLYRADGLILGKVWAAVYSGWECCNTWYHNRGAKDSVAYLK